MSQIPRLLSGKEPACSAGDAGLILGSGRSPGEGNGDALPYSGLEIPWTEEPGRLQSMGSQRVRHGLELSKNKKMRILIEYLPLYTSQGCGELKHFEKVPDPTQI